MEWQFLIEIAILIIKSYNHHHHFIHSSASSSVWSKWITCSILQKFQFCVSPLLHQAKSPILVLFVQYKISCFKYIIVWRYLTFANLNLEVFGIYIFKHIFTVGLMHFFQKQMMQCPNEMICKIERVRCRMPHCPDLYARSRPTCVEKPGYFGQLPTYRIYQISHSLVCRFFLTSSIRLFFLYTGKW